VNIFYLHKDPVVAAQMSCDKHVVKMILESAQLLCTCHRVQDGTEWYDKTANGRKIKRWKHPNPNLEPMKNGEPHINSYSMAELQSMYQTTNLDFYETALIFRQTRISELHEEINLNSVIQDRIEKFAQNIGWTLSYDKKKSSVKSKKAVQEVITYTQSQVDAVTKDLAARGLLSLKK